MTPIDSTTIVRLSNKLVELEKQINVTNEQYRKNYEFVESLTTIISTANDSIANQLSGISSYITIVGIIGGGVSVVLAFVLPWYYKKIIDIRRSAEVAMNRAKEAEVRSNELLKDFENNKKIIFNSIINIEIEHLINKLDEEPDNVINIHSRLSVFDINAQQAERIIDIIIKNRKHNFNAAMNMVTMLIPCCSNVLLDNDITKKMIVSNFGTYWPNLSKFDAKMLFSEFRLKRNMKSITLTDVVNILVNLLSDDDNDKTFDAIHSMYKSKDEFIADYEIIPNNHKFELARKRIIFEFENGV